MNQTSTKLSKSQKLLKEITEEKDQWRKEYYDKCNDLEKAHAKIEAYEKSEHFVKRILCEQHYSEIERLIEIIRWHIKPETAEIKKVKNPLYPPL